DGTKQAEQPRTNLQRRTPVSVRGPVRAAAGQDQEAPLLDSPIVTTRPEPRAHATSERRASERVHPQAPLPSLLPVAAPPPQELPTLVEPQAARPQPPSRDRLPASEVPLPPQRLVREIELTEREPAHTPSSPQQTIVIRETIRAPAETPQKP